MTKDTKLKGLPVKISVTLTGKLLCAYKVDEESIETEADNPDDLCPEVLVPSMIHIENRLRDIRLKAVNDRTETIERQDHIRASR